MTAVIATSAISLSAYAAYTKIAGDVNGDSKVTQADAVLAARKAAGWTTGVEGFDSVAADVDRDGYFDSNDVNAISKYVSGWSGYDKVGKSFTDSDVSKSFKITEQPHFYLNTITVDVTGGVAPIPMSGLAPEAKPVWRVRKVSEQS